MKHEKIFIREDGTRYKLDLSIRFEFTSGNPIYGYCLTMCAPNKRKWMGIVDEDTSKYRSASPKERDLMCKAEWLNYVTADEIYGAQLELWQKLKPHPLNTPNL